METTTERPIHNDRVARWVFTINNYDWEDINRLENIRRMPTFRFMIYGKETGEETGTPHLQGYMEFNAPVYRTTLRKQLQRAYLEPAKGSQEENIEYCSKQGQVDEFGSRTGKRRSEKKDKNEETRILLEDLKNMTRTEFEAVHTYEAFHLQDKLRKWEIEHLEESGPWGGDLKMKNFWIWGAPGTGKSRWAMSQGEGYQRYMKPLNKWWDGYNPVVHKFVVIDDFPRDNRGFIQHIKLWADRYPLTGEKKGSTIQVCPGRFFLIVTANHNIKETFKELGADEVDIEAIQRRFHEVEIMGPNDVWFVNKLDPKDLEI